MDTFVKLALDKIVQASSKKDEELRVASKRVSGAWPAPRTRPRFLPGPARALWIDARVPRAAPPLPLPRRAHRGQDAIHSTKVRALGLRDHAVRAAFGRGSHWMLLSP